MLDILKRDMICATLLILNGVFLLVCPVLSWKNFELLFLLTMVFYAVVNAIEFCLNVKGKDYSSAFTSLSCLGIGILGYAFHVVRTPKYLAITVLFWTMLMALVKLKKADSYHDKKSKMWCLQVFMLILFILCGVVTSINFLYGVETQILVFGYFIFIAGIFEFIDPFMGYLTKGKLK